MTYDDWKGRSDLDEAEMFGQHGDPPEPDPDAEEEPDYE